MSVFMYNVLFPFGQNDGLFSATDDPNTYNPPIPKPLRSSKNWLLWEPPTAVPADPEGNHWRDLGEASTILVGKKPSEEDEIWIRLAPDLRSSKKPTANATLQLVVSFGRPVKFRQQSGSPFTHNNLPDGDVVTTFLLGPTGANTSRGWCLKLGIVTKRPGHSSRALVDRYEFSLGAIVTEPAAASSSQSTAQIVRHYGEDPEMDIGD